MSLVVGTNTAALYSQNALQTNARSTATAMERLSTGVRVNSAKDDAAGLAIGQNMTSQIRGLNQAVRNINDSINLVQTAEGGLNSVSNMLQRMRELAVQASNGTYSDVQRGYLNQECQQLQSAISQVVDTTMWNDQKLLDGSYSNPIQIGSNTDVDMQVTIPSAKLEDLGASNLISTQVTKLSITTPPNPSPVMNQTASYIEYTDLGTTGETISPIRVLTPNVANDAMSIIGMKVYRGNGSAAMQIGTIDSQLDGTAGKALRINLQQQFNNGNFDNGSAGSTAIPGWTAMNQRVRLDGTNTVAGWPTPIDTITAPLGGIESTGGSGTFHTFLTSTTATGTGLSVQMSSNLNGVTNNPPMVGGVLHGPVLVSNNSIPLNSGDTITFDWRAIGGADAFDVYAYILNTQTGDTEELLNVTGASAQDTRPWTAVSHTVASSGDYKFVFSSGSWDASGGQAAGANLYIDNVTANSSVPPVLTSGQVSNLSNLVQYQNATPVTASVSIDGVTVTSAPGNSATDCAINLESAIAAQISGGAILNLSASRVGNDIILTSTVPGSTFTAIGAGTSDSNLIALSAENVQTNAGIIDISSFALASSALSAIDLVINAINSSRSTLGSYINRLAYAADNVTNISSNATQSRSTIIDADYAIETTSLAKNQIIQQAANAMLAQANVQPQAVMALLKNLTA